MPAPDGSATPYHEGETVSGLQDFLGLNARGPSIP
jgi:hypothetical protein